jgi:heat shock protein HtpX
VMEMCVDNPREGFADLFATHPSVDSRVEALVKFAGGHDPGPLVLAPPQEPAQEPGQLPPPASEGPWGGGEKNEAKAKPFLPDQPPVDLGDGGGPWGPKRN